MPDSRNDLSPGARVAIGVAMIALGVGVAAVGAQTLLADPKGLASEGLVGVPIGMVFAFGGLMLAVPQRYARLRALAAALLVTGMALAADWIAFGPGTRQFSGGIGSGTAGHGVPIGETPGRIAFGVCAVILNLLALLMWVRGFRSGFRNVSDAK